MSEADATSLPRFLVLEGIDGSGTTTQRERVAARLRERGHESHKVGLGLDLEERRHLHPVDLDLLLERCHLLGLSRREMAGRLHRLRGD